MLPNTTDNNTNLVNLSTVHQTYNDTANKLRHTITTHLSPIKLVLLCCIILLLILLIVFNSHDKFHTVTESVTISSATLPERIFLSNNIIQLFQHDNHPIIDIHTPTLCILARTYQSQYKFIPTFISLFSFNDKPVHVHLLITDTQSSRNDLEQIVETSNTLIGRNISSVLPITPMDAARYYNISLIEHGYAYTDAAIGYLLDQYDTNSNSRCDYITITNADNLYNIQYVHQIYTQIERQKKLIGVDWITRYAELGVPFINAGEYSDGSNSVKSAQWERGQIDLGCITYKLSLFNDTQIRYISHGAYGTWPDGTIRYTDADGLIVQAIRQTLPTEDTVLIRSVLLMHQ